MTKINCKILEIITKKNFKLEFCYEDNKKKIVIFVIRDNNLSINFLKKLFIKNKNKHNYVIVNEIVDDIFYGDLFINNMNIKKYDNFIFEKNSINCNKKTQINKLETINE